MNYEHSVEMDKTDIIHVISNSDDSSVVVRAVLSAIYYCDPDFAGKVLFESLKKITRREKGYFYGYC